MDYKIKLEYKGMGKQAGQQRQRAIQASQKAIDKKTGAPASDKALISSIQKLISSNKALENAINKMSGKGGGGGGGSSGGGGGGSAGRAGGRLGGGSIKSGGIAALGLAGFVIQKINQIGNAYIEKTSQQAGSVGIGGFRHGRGMYDAAGIGAGAKAYGQAYGKYVDKYNITKGGAAETALNIGGIHGLSAEDTMRTAGQFRRAGADYSRAANIGSGMGLGTELPTLLNGMAGILTDAVKNGINTSDMSKDMAQEISSLTMATPGKSVDAAMNIIKSNQGVREGVASGKMKSMQGLYTFKASQDMLMEKLNKEGGIEDFEKQGSIYGDQGSKLREARNKGNMSFDQLMQMDPNMAMFLQRKVAGEGGPELTKRAFKLGLDSFGGDIQKFAGPALGQGWVGSQSDLETQAKALKSPKVRPDTEQERAMYAFLNKGRKGPALGGYEAQGAKDIADRAKEVQGGITGRNIGRQNARDDLLLKWGETFADQSMKMEKQMINLANTMGGTAVEGVTLFAKAASGAADALSKAKSWIDKAWGSAKDTIYDTK